MAYIGKTPTQAVRNRYHFTATGGETSITSTEISNFAFEDGALVDVMLNGLTLIGDGNDYNTTTANTIGGLSALAANDVLEIVVYEPFSVFSGNVNGDFNINGNLKLSDTAITATAAELNLLDGVTATTAELNYVDGVTSNIQTQIDNISTDVVSDTTPQLGGNLDVNGNEITAATNNSDLVLSTSGTGNVKTVRGSTASSMSGTALAFNRSVGDGEIYDNTKNAFQFNHDSNKLALQVYNSAGTQVTSKALVIDDAGKIGVGLLSPARPIHIYNASPNLRLQDSDGSTGAYADIGADTSGSVYLLADHGNNSAGSRIRFYIDGSEKGQMEANGALFVDAEGGGNLRVDLRQGSAKMWINFETVGTASTQDSYNVTSITDETTATTRININNDMNNTGYSQVTGGSHGPNGGNYGRGTTLRTGYKYAGRYDVVATDLWSPSATDNANQSTMCHGDLA